MGSIQSRVPYEEYAAIKALNISSLKELRRSPLHYRHRLDHPKASAALTLGSAAHVAILEPERFDRDHAVWGERTESGNLRPRNGKLWDAFREANAGKRILTEDEHTLVMAMQRAVRSDATAMEYLASGDPEVTMEWAAEGRQCKGRVDWLTVVDGVHTIVGLKTARDCRPFIFGSASAKLGYHLQWAFYYDGYEALRHRSARMVEIVVESDAPHAVAVYHVPSDIIEQGRQEYLELMKILAECERAKHWPGPCVGEQILTLPSWAYESHDDVNDIGLEL